MKNRQQLKINQLERTFTTGVLKVLHLLPPFWLPKKREIKKALVVKYCCFGDAILSLYALNEYKKTTHSKMDLLCSHRVYAVYKQSGIFENIYTLPVRGENIAKEVLSLAFVKSCFQLFLGLRKTAFQELIDLELYRTSPLILKPLLNIPQSRGFHVPDGPLKEYDFSTTRGKETPEWLCFFQLLELPERPENQLLCPLALNSAQQTRESNEVTHSSIPLKIGLVMGSSPNWPQKKWPLHYFIQLAHALQNSGYQLILFGTAIEKEESDIFSRSMKQPVENTTGLLTYSDLIKKVSQCHLVVGNDTGTLHLAAACGVKTLTLFGPTNPKKWKPVHGEVVLLEKLKCRPCYYLSSMPDCDHFSCLYKLSPQIVLSRVLEVVQGLEWR